MTVPTGSPENESPLLAKLALASVLALGQSLHRDTVPGEMPFLLLPSMMPHTYDEIAGVLTSQLRPMVLYGFPALGGIVIGTWRATENRQQFEWRADGDQHMTRRTAQLYGREHDATFLVQWGEEIVALSLEEAVRWPREFQLEFCDWTHRSATPAEQHLGANVVLSFRRPPDRLGGISGGPR